MMITTNSLWDVLQIQLLQISVLIVLAGIVSWLLRNRHPHIVFALWAVVFVKCLTPPLMISSVGLFAWQAPPSQASDHPDANAVPVQNAPVIGRFGVHAMSEMEHGDLESCTDGMFGYPDPATQPLCDDQVNGDNSCEESSPVDLNGLAQSQSNTGRAATPALVTTIAGASQLTSAPLATANSPWLRLRNLLVIIWLAGIVVFAAVAVRRWFRCWLTIRKSRIQPDTGLLERVERVKQEIGFRRSVRLVVNDGNYGPMVFGYLRPVLVLPCEVIQESQARNLDHVIAHELIHVRRGDTLLCLLQFAAQTIWWFNPMVRWASRTTDDISERCCDLEVVSGLKCKPSEYVRSLLGIIEMRQTLQYVAGAAGLRSSDITFRRLKWLAGQRRALPLGTPLASWLIASVTALLVLPGSGLPTQQEHPKIKTAQEAIQSRDQEAHNAFQHQDWEKSAKLYRAIVDENPDSGLAWLRLGYALQATGKIDEAIFANEKASEFPRTRPSALYNLACALTIKGEHDAALEKLSAALDAGFARPNPLDEDEDFAPIKDNERFRELVQRHKEMVIANTANNPLGRGSMSTEIGSTGTRAARVIDTKSLEQLAFWQGTWNVTDAEGKDLGSSVISWDDKEHLIVESWAGLDGNSGTGKNLFDPGSSLWIQKFEGSDREYSIAGAFDGKSLKMSGDIKINGQRRQDFQWDLTKMDDGRLKRTTKISNDGGTSWESTTIEFYVPNEKQ